MSSRLRWSSRSTPLSIVGSELTRDSSGGLEMLFSNERKHTITLPARVDHGSHPNISYLLQYLVDNVMNDERKELFILEDNVYGAGYI